MKKCSTHRFVREETICYPLSDALNFIFGGPLLRDWCTTTACKAGRHLRSGAGWFEGRRIPILCVNERFFVSSFSLLWLDEVPQLCLVLESRLSSCTEHLVSLRFDLVYFMYFVNYICKSLLAKLIVNHFSLCLGVDNSPRFFLFPSLFHVDVCTVEIVLWNLSVVV